MDTDEQQNTFAAQAGQSHPGCVHAGQLLLAFLRRRANSTLGRRTITATTALLYPGAERDIQVGEHSSVEDARATMAIFQRVAKEWDKLLQQQRFKYSKPHAQKPA